MGIAKIKKRDGRVVSFDRQKIRVAMEKAARAVNPNADTRPYDLMTDHVMRYVELRFPGVVPDVEQVQDLVEKTLMEYGLYDVAKAYILYRAEHAKIRQVQESKQPSEDQLKIRYVNREGHAEPINETKVRQRITTASRGIENLIDVDMIMNEWRAGVYEEMTADELDQSVVMAARSFLERDPAYSILASRLAAENLYREVFGSTAPKEFIGAYRTAFIKGIKATIVTGRLQPAMGEFDLEKLAEAIDPKRDELLEYMGAQVLYDRYLLREEGGEGKVETFQAFWMRVAMGLALNEKNKEKWAIKFYDLFSTLRYLPSTPTMFQSGTTYPQLSSCYLNYVDDDLGHIFKVYGDNAQMSKFSGGIGTSWSALRATGALIKKTNVSSQGVIPFLRIANDVTVAINRSGKRRGATCVYLETWHYDFEDFLDLRRNTGDERRRAHDMNTANWIPDLFMKRVTENGQWTFFSPDETPELNELYGQAFDKKYAEYEAKADAGEIKLWKRIPARDLWRRMISMLFETGHPWITFKDACNIRSPQDHVGVIHNSNLCTEITLNNSPEETAVCNLGSVNLALHTVNGKLDEKMIEDTVIVAMRSLDNVIDLNYYPTIEGKVSNLRHRPVGLGIMGFQDALYLAEIDFDSEAAVELADNSMEVISYYAIKGSAELAAERGAYESYKGSKWDRGIFPVDTLDLLEAERGMPIGVSRRGRLDWAPVRDLVKKHGIRNSNTMAIAPTSNLGNITGTFPCIEPIFKNLYVKSNMSGEFTVINKYLVNDLKKLGLWNETLLDEMKRHDGSIQEMTQIPPRLRSKYKEAFEIDTEWLIKTAAYRGKWIDQSQSLNIFFRGTSGKRLAEIYLLGWHLGLKTTYYLRTLSATAIEKSTIDINKWEKSTDAPLMAAEALEVPRVVAVPEPMAILQTVGSVIGTSLSTESEESAAPRQDSLEAAIAAANTVEETAEDAPKLCLIDDPECEACQ